MTLKDQVSLCVTEMLEHVCCQDIGHALAYTIGIDWKGREVGQMQRDGVAARKLGTNIVCLSTSLSPSHLAHLLATLPTSLPPCPATTLIGLVGHLGTSVHLLDILHLASSLKSLRYKHSNNTI